MKKLPYIFGIIVLLIFVGINFQSFQNFYNNYAGNYSETNNKTGEYNILLKEGNNSYTKSTLSGATLDQKIDLLEQSVVSYGKSLEIFTNEHSAKNLEFVQEQLRILKLKEEKKKQEGGKQEQDTNKPSPQSSPKGKEEEQKNGEKSDKQEGEKKEGGETGKQDENGEQSGEETKAGEKQGLSEKTKKILEQKAKELQEQQGEIGKFYNKNYKQKQKSAFDNFADIFGRSQFDNGFPNEREQKDW